MLSQIRNNLTKKVQGWSNIISRSPYWGLEEGVMINRGHEKAMHRKGAEIGVEIKLPPGLFYSSQQKITIWETLRTILQQSIPEGERGRVIVQCIQAHESMVSGYGESVISSNALVNTLVEGKLSDMHKRRLLGEVREWHFYVTCTVKARNRKKDIPLSTEEIRELRQQGAELRQDLISKFEMVGIPAREMTDDDVLRLCKQYWNPDLEGVELGGYEREQEGVFPQVLLEEFEQLKVTTTRSQIHFSESLNKKPKHLILGNKFIKVACVSKNPKKTLLGSIEEVLSRMDEGSFYLMLDFEHEPYYNMLRKYNSKFQRLDNTLSQKEQMPLAVDSSTRVNHKETEYALERMEEGEHSFRCGIAMVMIGDTPQQVEAMWRNCKAGFNKIKCHNFVIKNLGNSKHFQTLAPFAGTNNQHMFTMLEGNAADCIPISGPWMGHHTALHLFDNRWGSVTRVDPYNPGLTNFNGLIVAGSGTGKTQLAQSLLKDHAAANHLIVVIDKGYGYGPFMELADAAILKVEPMGSTSINPFDLAPGLDKPDDDHKAFLLSLVRCIIPTTGTAQDKIGNNILLSCFDRVYRRARQETLVGGELEVRYVTPRMSDLVKALQTISEINGRSADTEELDLARELAAQLEPYTGKNAYGRFLDSETNVDISSNLLYFDVTKLESYPDLTAVGILMISKLLYNKFMSAPGVKKIAVIDEAWAMLKIPEAQAFIVDLYRRARHMGGAIYCISQKLTDFLAIPGIVENTSVFFLSKLKGDAENEAIRTALKLSDSAMAIYQQLKVVPRKYSEFLFWEAAGNESQGDVIRVILSPVEYWTFTTNNDDKAKRLRYVKEHGSLDLAIRKLAGMT